MKFHSDDKILTLVIDVAIASKICPFRVTNIEFQGMYFRIKK